MPSKTKETVRIIGIDPGYERIGFAVIEKSKGKEKLLYSECFQTKAKDDIYSRLHEIGQHTEKIFNEYEPDAIAMESLFITKNQKTAMRVAEARGIMIYEAMKKSVPVFEYSPMQIKSAITGDGTSDKQRITKMIHILVEIDRLIKLDDEYDSIAVALTHSAVMRHDFSGSQSKTLSTL